MKKVSALDISIDTIITVSLIIFSVIMIYPFLYIINSSLSDPVEVMKSGAFLLYPKGLQFGGYQKVFENRMFLTGYQNTLIKVVVGTSINMLMTTLGAYALSRKSLFGRNAILLFITITMFFHAGMIPNYILIKNLNMLDSLWAIMIPNAISVMNLIIMRTQFQQLPEANIESAKIDGANDFFILWKIVLPLSKAVISVMVLFYAAYHWNDFFFPLLYIKSRKLYPLQLVLRDILIANSTNSISGGASADNALLIAENIKYATVMVATLPILMVYPYIQKYFVQGVMIGSIKG